MKIHCKDCKYFKLKYVDAQVGNCTKLFYGEPLFPDGMPVSANTNWSCEHFEKE